MTPKPPDLFVPMTKENHKMKIALAAALVGALAAASPASAQSFTTGSYGNGWFHSYTTGPYGGGFAGGFAQGLANARAAAAMNAATDAATAVPLGSFLPGIIAAPNGRQLQFEIQVTRSGGAVRAFDPKRHERFAGTYAAVGQVGPGLVPVTAMLTGNRGSSLSCQMQIQAGSIPQGNGDCMDEKNVRYQLRF
jgi:hypothetical protein